MLCEMRRWSESGAVVPMKDGPYGFLCRCLVFTERFPGGNNSSHHGDPVDSRK